LELDEPYQITIEIVNEDCEGLRIIKDMGIQQCTLIDIRKTDGDNTRHLVKFPSSEIDNISEDVFSSIRKGKVEHTAWFDTDGCDVCRTMLSQSSFLISGRHVKDYTIIYTFISPNFQSFQKVISTLEEKGLKPKILEAKKLKTKSKILTSKQERVLWFALKTGFYEFPRKTNLEKLSNIIGVSPSTLCEVMRRGMRRVLEEHFETEDTL
jgi:predicted DNA binding protein